MGDMVSNILQYKKCVYQVGFQVLTAASINMTAFQNMA
jgi:hypothetical protein